MDEKKLSRRDAVKLLGAVIGAAALSQLPSKWNTPELAAGVLPAHARQSNGGGGAGVATGSTCPVDTTIALAASPSTFNTQAVAGQFGYSIGFWVSPNAGAGTISGTTALSFATAATLVSDPTTGLVTTPSISWSGFVVGDSIRVYFRGSSSMCSTLYTFV